MRHVSLNRPFVIRKGASNWPARKKWNISYLKSIMGSQHVNVAMTPLGNADSILPLQDGGALFIKPYETTEPFSSVADAIAAQELPLSDGIQEPVRYAQTQNDNLRNEYAALFSDVPKEIPFARIALEKEPDAINFWLGNSRSTTALHKDNYENIYVQILGQKHFVLLPPVEAPCVNEKAVLAATYKPRLDSTDELKLVPHVDVPGQPLYTPFCTWDPDEPEKNATRFSSLSQPLRVTLNEGDMLYLPALWYHKVSQSCNDEGVCCAVNYWFDLEFSGGFWAISNFIRGAGLLTSAAPNAETSPKTEEAGERKDV